MAVNNSITQRKPLDAEASVTYQVAGADIKLSPGIVRNYLTNGNGTVTDQEVTYFINLCKYQKLNPLIKECYLIKFGNNPATMVVGKEALLKRAMRNPKYKGHEAGVIIQENETGNLVYRNGSFIIQEEEKLIGGWAKVYVEGYQVPIEAGVSFREFAGVKDGRLNAMWGGKPGTMIRKVALVTALREAFPDDIGGMYAAEEVGAEENEAAMPEVQVEPEMTTEPFPQPEMQEEDYSQIPQDYDQPQIEELPGGF